MSSQRQRTKGWRVVGIAEESAFERVDQKELAAPVEIATLLTADELPDVVRQLCLRLNAEATGQPTTESQGSPIGRRQAIDSADASLRYDVAVASSGVLVGYGLKAESVVGGDRKRRGIGAGHWLARVTSATSVDGRVVSLMLVKWNVGSDGELQNRDEYLLFAHALHDAVRVETPSNG
jgi:hypothetical protein